MTYEIQKNEYPNLVGVFRREFPIITRKVQSSGQAYSVTYYGGRFEIRPAPEKNRPYAYRVFKI